MPYSSTKQLPPAAKSLPEAAKRIWLAAFNASFKQYGEEKAFAIAMAAVKNRYQQVQGRWVAKADAAPSLPLGDEELPLEVKTMPAAAKSIFRAAFRKARKEEPDSLAAVLALAAVKKHFARVEGDEGEEWVKKGEAESRRGEEIASILAAVESAGGAGEGDDGDEGEGGGGEGGEGGGSERKKRRAAAGEPAEPGEPGYSKTTKTTETTETRGGGGAAQDSIQLTETFMLDAATSERFGMRLTPSGYLVAEPRIARSGIQVYKGREVGVDNMDEVRVYRPEAEVFDKRAMASLAHRPVTLDHPDESVDPRNWRKLAVGHSTGDVARDGEFIRVPLTLMDQSAIDAARSGTSQLSVGYAAKLVWGAGQTADGQFYDATQTEIRANHIALVRAARGGDKLRMGDSHDRRSKAMTERTLNLDGVNITVEDKDGQILERHLTELRKQATDAAAKAETLAAQVADLTKAAGVKDGEVAALKQRVEDNALTPDKLDKALNIRMDIVDRATTFFGDQKYAWQSRSDAQIRRDVVSARMGDQKAKAMNDDAVEGAFLSITEPEQQDGFRRMADSFSGRPANNGSLNDKAAAAYDKRNEELQNRWKANKGKAVGAAG